MKTIVLAAAIVALSASPLAAQQAAGPGGNGHVKAEEVKCPAALLLPAVQKVREAAARMTTAPSATSTTGHVKVFDGASARDGASADSVTRIEQPLIGRQADTAAKPGDCLAASDYLLEIETVKGESK